MTAKKKQPDNVEWIVHGRVVLDGATAIVHAKTRAEALEKAQNGEYFGGIDYETAELVDYDFRVAEANVDGD